MSILITGGFGFIGRAIIKQLLDDNGAEILVIDSLLPQIHGEDADYSELANHPQITFIKDDIANINDHASHLANVETVVHLAAETGTGQSMYEIESYYRTNVQSTATILEAMVKNKTFKPKRFLLSSSRSIYGEGAYVKGPDLRNRIYPDARRPEDMKAGQFDFIQDETPLTAVATLETDATTPKSIYAASKLAQEDICSIACEALGVEFIALRLQNVYGPGQSLKNPYTGIISIFINILRQGGDINVYEDGIESRDFVFVDDVASVFVEAISANVKTPGFFNVGMGVASTVLDLVDAIETKMDAKGRHFISGDFRPGDIRHAFADITALKAQFKNTPKVDLTEGVARTIEWAFTQPVEADLSNKAKKELEKFLSDDA